MRYRVNGAIATRWPNFTSPTVNGWKSFVILAVDVGTTEDEGGSDQVVSQEL